MENKSSNFVHTNVRVFYNIAKEAYTAMEKDGSSRIRPDPNNEQRRIITYDPDQKSFKNAFITIVFCGIFLESLLHILIVEREGLHIFNNYDRKSYEDKLKLLGCNDQSILDKSKQYKNTRKRIVHEKVHIDNNSFTITQEEAALAMEFVNQVVTHFDYKID